MKNHLEARKKMGDYNVNDVVTHKELGRGIIQAIDKQLIDIDFNGEVKRLNFEVLVKKDLIDKL
jgi:hypothetical protein